MKITNIVPDKTTDSRLTVRTEPALTEEVYRRFSRSPFNGVSFSRDGEFLVITAKTPPASAITRFAAALTDAEDELARERKAAQEAHQKLLDDATKATGLPVGDPSIT